MGVMMNLFVAKVVITFAIEIGIVCILLVVSFGRYLITIGSRD